MKKTVIDYIYMSIGVLLIGVAVYFLKLTNGFTTGGVSGVGTVLGKITNIRPSFWIIIINIFLLILSFMVLGRATGAKTVYCSLLFSFIMWAFEFFIPLSRPLTDQPFLELTIAVILTSLGSAIVFNVDATTGGTDILAMILKKFTNLNVGKALFCVDFIVVASTYAVFGIEIGLFSSLGLFIKAFLVDSIIENLNTFKYFIIITDEAEKIQKYILNNLKRGVTISSAEGGYTKNGKQMLHTVCRRAQAVRLKGFVKETDPNAFIVITTSHEIIGRGFRSM